MKIVKTTIKVFISIVLVCKWIVSPAQSGVERKMLFWNLENYFDPFDDPLTKDEEFTPSGERHWTWRRFLKKRNDIAKVIIAVSHGEGVGDKMPLFIGLCEIENRMVLRQLVEKTLLSRYDYGIVHRESQDKRGIDVALLYKKDRVSLIDSHFYDIMLPDTSSRTRPILYAKGVIDGSDTAHIFVNHFPSKFGGERISTPKRERVVTKLKMIIDSILNVNPRANIIVTGDFNDTPESDVIKQLSSLNNLAFMYLDSQSKNRNGMSGTIRYKGVWELIDQFLVSDNLLSGSVFKIMIHSYILEKDKEYLGVKPRRTYIGPRYNGGVSDHLPIMLFF